MSRIADHIADQEDCGTAIQKDGGRGPGCGHPTTTMVMFTAMLRDLYAAGYGYNDLANLTRLDMSHADMRQFLLAGVADRQWTVIEEMMSR